MPAKKQVQTTEKISFDEKLMCEIQAQGGISFRDERYIKTGDGYEACLHIYQYPKHLDTHWLSQVININNVVALIDVSTEDSNEVRKNINKSMQEQSVRYTTATTHTEQQDAKQRYAELSRLYDETSILQEIVKLIHIRLFVSARTLEELDKEVKKLQNYLESIGYKAVIFLNETKAEWKAMFQSYTAQDNTAFRRYGQPVLSDTLAGGDPFHFSSLSDPLGTYLGLTTSVSGSVLFDMFSITQKRLSYNGLCIGRMGAGKSTLLKKLLLDRAIKGDYIRGFDVTGEFETLIKYLGGNIISLDGSEGIINALEVFKTAETEEQSFSYHLSKLKTVYKFLVPTATDIEMLTFENLINEFYCYCGLTRLIEKDGIQLLDFPKGQITGLRSSEYPIWSDFLVFVNKTIDKEIAGRSTAKKEIDVVIKKRYSNIQLVISNLVKNYGYIFNGHTSVENVLDTQIVFFNIKNLVSFKEEIFDTQMYIALSLCWDNCIKKGREMKEKYETNQIRWEDIIHFVMFIDEAHHIINTRKTSAVEQLIIYEREARKLFGGILYASQSVRDFVPEDSEAQGIDKIKTLFELTQYKFIMQQDSNSVDLLNKVFKHQLTASEIEVIPKLSKGECVLAISSDKNIQFKIEITDQEKDLFTGGA